MRHTLAADGRLVPSAYEQGHMDARSHATAGLIKELDKTARTLTLEFATHADLIAVMREGLVRITWPEGKQ